MQQFKGACLCGACQYVIKTNKPKAMYLCHCSRCRKETGTVHAANVFFDDAQLSWLKGENNITDFQLEGTRKKRAFCKTCGSPMPKEYGHNLIVLPAGSLDNEIHLEPTAHIFYESRASWEDALSHLKRFAAVPL